jgi:alpha-pyrone synthase
MTATYITSIGVANPPHRFSQTQISQFMSKALCLGKADERRLRMIYKATAIEYRYSVIEDYGKITDFTFFPNEENLEPFPSTAQRMKLYEKYAVQVALQAVSNCFTDKEIAKEITHLITVSCTGMYAPGLDIDLIENLGLSPNTQRIGINFMGCYAAFNALKVADAICKSNPSAKILIADVELCTLHFQKDSSEDCLLSNAIFGDGAAALLVESEKRGEKAMRLDAFYCDLAPEGKSDMAWFIRDFGFEMRLSSYVPHLLENKMSELTQKLLQKLDLHQEAIDLYAIHPGGRKILEVAEKCLGISTEQNHFSYEVLQNFGNMSSATVPFVLKNIWDNFQEKQKEEYPILSLAFGPGLTVESALLRLC